MRRTVIFATICLFLLSVMLGSWMVQVSADAGETSQWRLLPFRQAFGLGMRSYLFSLPVAFGCLVFHRRLWPAAPGPGIVLRNVVVLSVLGLVLGRINFATSTP